MKKTVSQVWKTVVCVAAMASLAGWVQAADEPVKDAPYENSLGMKFVPIPGTKVLFSIWDTRVKDYAAFTNANPGKNLGGTTTNTVANKHIYKFPVSPEETCPVVFVSWDDAKDFCAWLTEKEQKEGRLVAGQEYRLPTDAEWSIAAAPQGYFIWGDQWPPPAGAGNFNDGTLYARTGTHSFISQYENPYPEGSPNRGNSAKPWSDGWVATSPVGSFAANKYGLYDMAGNVLQWCEDLYTPSDTNARVLRGSSWLVNCGPGEQLYGGRVLLMSGRHPTRESWRSEPMVGFRCVLVSRTAAQERPTKVPALLATA